jgi:hypothetical protein
MIYTPELIEKYGDNLPAQYITIDSESNLEEGEITNNTYTTSKNGSYLDVIFSSIRALQAEVTKLRNSFKYGINSYTDKNTNLSSSIDDEDEEPIWAVDEDDLSLITAVPMGAGNGINPSSNVDVTVSN